MGPAPRGRCELCLGLAVEAGQGEEGVWVGCVCRGAEGFLEEGMP